MNAEPKIGRPRAFDKEAAVDAAMRVFWEKGYEGATLSELEDAMGIHRSSMFAAFGNKEALYKLALERYASGPMSFVSLALQQVTLKGVFESLIYGTADFLSCPENPRGCLAIQGALACGTEAKAIQATMIEWRKSVEAALKRRIQQAQKTGEALADVNASDLARYISATLAGLAIQAANGALRSEELKRVAELALGFVGGRKLW